MRVAIHQPHYFPWLGYFHKMASSDAFVLLDQVQFVKNSTMIRNRVLDNNGVVKYLTISGDTRGFLGKEYKELLTKDVEIWTKRQLEALKNYYRKSPYCEEGIALLEDFFRTDRRYICEWTCSSIELCRNILGIDTKLIYQSAVDYDRSCKKSDLVLGICNSLSARYYMSGRGASVEYLDREAFKRYGVSILFQNFNHPVYEQVNSNEFQNGLSVLDVIFNRGIEGTKKLFWDSVEGSDWSELI